MFTLYYFIKYFLIGGFTRTFCGDEVYFNFDGYDIMYDKNIFDGYVARTRSYSKRNIDADIKEFLDGMDTFWLDYIGAADDFISHYDSTKEYMSHISAVPFRELLMYYADVVNRKIHNRGSARLEMLHVLKANIYCWLTVASNKDRRKVLNILKDEHFDNFNLSRGFDSYIYIHEVEDRRNEGLI